MPTFAPALGAAPATAGIARAPTSTAVNNRSLMTLLQSLKPGSLVEDRQSVESFGSASPGSHAQVGPAGRGGVGGTPGGPIGDERSLRFQLSLRSSFRSARSRRGN